MTSWLDPASPPVRSAVVSGGWGRLPHTDHAFPAPVDDQIDVIASSLEVASDILTRLTGGTTHPALQVNEEFTCYARTRSLRTTFQPLRAVASVAARGYTSSLTVGAVLMHGGSIRFLDTLTVSDSGLLPTLALELDFAHWFARWVLNCYPAGPELLSVVYNVGSTVTASARQAVIALAHELYLQVSPCAECGECRLPDRTTNVTREGLSYNVTDPLDPTSSGGTGLPDVDLWVRGVNPRQATRASGIYDPSSPPGVVRSVRAARPNFSAVPTAGPSASAHVTATGVVA